MALAGTAVPAADASAADGRTARPYRIVAFGDSYTAGNGALLPFERDRDGCHRAAASYPALLAARLTAAGRPATALNVACSGARTAAITRASRSGRGVVLRAQVDQVPAAVAATAQLAVVSTGGNDVGFVDAIRCVIGQPVTGGCEAVVGASERRFPALVEQTATALRAIARRLPRARVVLVGYPLLTRPACAAAPAAAPRVERSQRLLDRLQRDLVARLAAEPSAGTGAPRYAFVSTERAFTGRGPCAPPGRRYVNALQLLPLTASFHPNRAGNAATARLVLALLQDG